MALITCPRCGKQISDKAEKCPHCGLDIASLTTQTTTEASALNAARPENKKRRKRWPIYLIVGLCLIAGAVTLWFFGINGLSGNKGGIKGKADTTTTAPDPNAPDNKYLTQDLRMWWLYGPVVCFQTTVFKIDNPSQYFEEVPSDAEFVRSIQFDTEGRFYNTIDGFYTIKQVANRDGDKIIEAKDFIDDFELCTSRQWSYYPNGLVKTEQFSGIEFYYERQYFYNEAGEISREEEIIESEGDQWKTVSMFSIKDRDNYGNWTKIVAEVSEYEYDYEKDDFSSIPIGHNYQMYNRIIRYYDQELMCQFVVINATDLRLRFEPSLKADTFKWKNGTNQHPKKGGRYYYLDETDDFYKIDYKGRELWVSKQYSYLEKIK